MKVDINPQWGNLVRWFWDTSEGQAISESGMSILDMLYNEYGAERTYCLRTSNEIYLTFPDEQSYTMFLLRWASEN